ncbi:MAG: ParA family protein [Alphaproteobacteria bacterium]|nr:ParA family protein [Alphaproteobacteria bacterium]
MKVVVLASAKGGVGKTTLAAHLAVHSEAAGTGPVVVFDTDPQGSLAAWWNARAAEAPQFATAALADLPARLADLKAAGFGLAVIDTPPAMTEAIAAVVRLADLVLVPSRPSPVDLRALGPTVDLVEAAGRPFAFVLTQAKAAARLTGQAVAVLSQHGPVAPSIICDRVDFAAAMTDGRTVGELDAKSRSAGEIRDLWLYVEACLGACLHAKKKARKKEMVHG